MTRALAVPQIRLAVFLFALFGLIGWLLFAALFSRAPAQDLMVFHTAGRLALAGDFALLRDGRAFTGLLNRTHADWLGAPLVLHPWVYPPPTLLLAALLAPMPFAVAYGVFMAAGIACLGACLWRWWRGTATRPLWLGLVLLCPATAFCIGSGQLSFFIAGIFLCFLLIRGAHPFAAGCLLGLLFLKPQFGLMVPVALLAGRDWRGLAGAASTSLLLILLSLLAFGLTPWRDWLHLMFSGDPALTAWMDTGRHFGQSADTYARLLGAPPRMASLAQLLAIALSAVCVWCVFARRYADAAPLRSSRGVAGDSGVAEQPVQSPSPDCTRRSTSAHRTVAGHASYRSRLHDSQPGLSVILRDTRNITRQSRPKSAAALLRRLAAV
jgi:hypothetical protein